MFASFHSTALDRRDTHPSVAPPRFAPTVLLTLWVAFWLALFLFGLQEFRWQGGQGLWQVSVKYATAATACTGIGLIQLARARHADHLLGQPLLWFAFLWKWLPLETLCFVVAKLVIPRSVAWIFGLPYDSHNWLEGEIYDCARFLFFNFLAGGVQLGIHTSCAWSNERLRAVENARLAQEARLMQLTQQLQPHFLFNGMNLISSLIHTDPTLADTLLGKFATLFRAATGAGQCAEQSLEEELVLLRAYADIMCERFSERVRLEWDIDPKAASCMVPTFGLQPLLENCFHHVVERRAALTHIVIRARREYDLLRVAVEDDGTYLVDVPVLGIGLGNLKRRLRALHGDRARLNLVPKAANGLVVSVELPCGC